MTRLTDAIRRSYQTESAGLGFAAVRTAPRPTMLVALLAPAGAATTAPIVILDGRQREVSAGDVSAAKAANGNAVVGAWPGDPSPAKVTDLIGAGVDFIVFAPDTTPAASLLDESIGYVIALPADPSDDFLRSIEPLTLDAGLLAELPQPLTVSAQLAVARNGQLARKALAAPVDASISAQDLECLRGAGVAVLVTTDAGAVAGLVDAVSKLPPRRRRRDERPTVSLPRANAIAEDGDDEDDD
jgi:hypothetical protein